MPVDWFTPEHLSMICDLCTDITTSRALRGEIAAFDMESLKDERGLAARMMPPTTTPSASTSRSSSLHSPDEREADAHLRRRRQLGGSGGSLNQFRAAIRISVQSSVVISRSLNQGGSQPNARP
jgi:hypothetical protein